MKLTIHIGTTKTGSTSIQAFLMQNQAALLQQGVLYPTELGPQHHVKATVAALSYEESPDLLRFCKIADNTAHDQFRVKTAKAFTQEIAQSSNINHVIISSEHLHSRCVSHTDINRFKQLFCMGFDDIEIVVYVRPQIDHMVSLFSTNLRHGYRGTLDEHITAMLGKKHASYFNLRDIIKRWEKVFGKGIVTVRPFGALNRENGGAVTDFCKVANIATDRPDIVQVPARNESINVKGQELLMVMNKGKGVPPSTRNNVVRWLEQEFNGAGIKPTAEAIQTVQSQFAKSNAWVVKTYFPDHPNYLAPRG